MAGKRNEKGPSHRQLGVGEKVRHALTEMLGRDELRDPLLERAVISVTEVRMSTDLKLGTAYITVLGQTDVQPFVDALNVNAKFVRGRLSPALRQMKYMPEIRFRVDTSFDNYAKIDALLRSPVVVKDLETENDQKDDDDEMDR